MRWLVIFSILFLTGCSNLSLSDLATTAGAGTGALAGAATGLGPLVTLTTTVAGGAAGGALVGETVTTAEACSSNPETCNTIAFYSFLEDFWHWLVGAGVALITIAWLIPGPQSLFRRNNHAKADTAYHRRRSNRSDLSR